MGRNVWYSRARNVYHKYENCHPFNVLQIIGIYLYLALYLVWRSRPKLLLIGAHYFIIEVKKYTLLDMQ